MRISHILYHSFCHNRDYAKISGLTTEQVLLILRAHPITNLPWLLLSFFLIIVPLIFAQYLVFLPIYFNQLLFIVVFWYALVFFYILYKFFYWYFNVGVVTNQRIIDVDAVNLLQGHTTAINLQNIEEVNQKTLGLFASWFDYGNVYIETAAAFPNVEFIKVPKPNEVVQIINSSIKNRYGNRKPN
jgi:hypothetical protein